MNLGVLLLYCKEGRTTSFTRAWADGAIQRVADYFFAQSGGRETITYKVYDWIQLPLTEAAWSALGMGAYTSLRPSIEQQLGEKLDPFTHILIGIDHSLSSGGTTPGALTYLAASNFTPSLIGHELGHRYGAGDAFRETAGGNNRYENRYCVMGALGWPATFTDTVIADPSAPMLNQSGPGMSAPTLIATGWLNEDDHGLGLDITGNSIFSSSGRIEDLSALAGAPSPGWTRPPVVIRYQDLLVEYRIGDPDGWDRGLPDPGAGAVGRVIVHRSAHGAPSAVYVDSVGAKPGAMLVLGKDNPLDIFNPGPLRVGVLSVNTAARTVRLHFSRRGARPLPSGETYGGVDVGAGGWVWTPGRGFTRVPPHSPLVRVLEEIARVHALQELITAASANEVGDLSEETSRALRTLQESVGELGVEPSLSPLAHSLKSISELQAMSERLDSSPDDRELTRQFIEASRERLGEVKHILADQAEEEGQQ